MAEDGDVGEINSASTATGGADHHHTPQPRQVFVAQRDQGTSRLLGDDRIHRIGPTQTVLGLQRSGLVTEGHI
jgi:hypothetical protein